jgi:diguanylate cyclase (GGDEF)-like protein/PAS domain S-box-containing protein
MLWGEYVDFVSYWRRPRRTPIWLEKGNKEVLYGFPGRCECLWCPADPGNRPTAAYSPMSTKPIKVLLLVEDNEGDARLLREMLNEPSLNGAEVSHVTTMSDAESHLGTHAVDIIVLDLGLPDAHGLEAIRRAHAAAPRIPLVVLTGLDDESLAAQALQEGAQDYLLKGQIETRGLLRSLRYAIERKTMEEALFAEKERAQVTLNCIGDAVVCTDIAGDITFLNPVAEAMTGWPLTEAVGRPMAEVFRTLSVTSTEPTETTAELAILQIRSVHLPPSCVLIRRDGLEIPIEDTIAAIHDRQGQAIGAVIVFRDVSVARAMAQQITHSAEHDFLTGLPNRMLLNDRISQAIASARRHTKQVAVLFLDLDGFKHINDSLGHPVGDKLLQSIATRLAAIVRGADTVSRQGGDEFVVLLPDLQQPEDAVVMAGRILREVAHPHSVDQYELHVTTSIGVSVFPDDGMDAETLIKNADTAMYQAKENGRQSVQFFKPAMNARAVERQSIEESLRRALEREEFTLHYQPKISIKTGAITGAEALIRWTHPSRGPISPAQFIPIAEDCGLILPIGRWVLRHATLQAQAWVTAGLRPMTMAVNVSAVEFRDDDFLRGLFAILDESRFNPRALELELTESVLMKRVASTHFILQTLRKAGVQVAIDDFGTGYSSLSYLRKFPIDTLKIDQSFVGQIHNGDEDAAIVTAVIGMARSLKLRVVAEGVETYEELEFLHAHHCEEAQGYYFSRPVPAGQFAKLLEAGISSETRAALRTLNERLNNAESSRKPRGKALSR